MDIELKEFKLAAERLKSVLHHTNLDYSSTFSKMTGGDIYLKCENTQLTGSFKIRGASNKIARLAEAGSTSPVVAASAGNHAQGVAYAATKFGMKSTIVMPQAAPIAKVKATEGYGAQVLLEGNCFDDAYSAAIALCEEKGCTFIHPYDDIDVITGQGTLGLEILDDLPTADIIIVPAGGGGLLAGIACAVKQVNPRIKVYGVQAEGCDPIVKSFEQKSRVVLEKASTIADGIAVKAPGEKTVELINRYVDGMLEVTDLEISGAILLLMERCKMIVEPAGATPLAAVLNGKLDVEDKEVVCVMSGGNIDVSFIQNIIEQGLAARHRRIKFIVKLEDKPGSLVNLLNVIAAAGGNILTVEHDKLSRTLNPNETNVHIVCEVGGEEHGKTVISKIEEHNFSVVVEEM